MNIGFERSGERRPLRPVVPEPLNGRIEAIQRDPCPGPKARELLAITENAVRYRLVPVYPGDALVCVSDANEAVDAGHAVFLPRDAEKSTVFSPRATQGAVRYSYRMDKISVILARIEALMKDQGFNPTTLSKKATGGRSTELIRNWQRAVKDGKNVSARLESVALVAHALGVSDVWLSTGQGSKEAITDEERDLLAAYRAIRPDRRTGHLRAALETLRLGHDPAGISGETDADQK